MKSTILLFFLFSFSALGSEFTSVSDWYEGRKYDYRYITSYRIEVTSRPHKNFPWIQEECHEDGDRFANWAKTVSYEISYSGALSLNLLGLGIDLASERGESVEFSFERWIHATNGLKARHVLYEEFETWIGSTAVEYRYADNSTVTGEKSYPFVLEKMNYGLVVKREVLKTCD